MATHVIPKSELPPGTVKQVGSGRQKVAVCNVDGTLYGIQDRCPHRFANLSDGRLDGETIICPKHKGQFYLATGEPKVWVAEPPIMHLLGKLIPPFMRRARTYDVTATDDNVVIDG
ncbi:MAG: Rieske 2Fe-2S domain-containing protein [Dehalococcoidia bacterium]